MQAFVTELLAMLRTCGLTTPEPFNLPETIFHRPSNTFPGETLDRAFQAGRSHFKKDPDVLFVLLPDTGGAFPTPSLPGLHRMARAITASAASLRKQHIIALFLAHASWSFPSFKCILPMLNGDGDDELHHL